MKPETDPDWPEPRRRSGWLGKALIAAGALVIGFFAGAVFMSGGHSGPGVDPERHRLVEDLLKDCDATTVRMIEFMRDQSGALSAVAEAAREEGAPGAADDAESIAGELSRLVARFDLIAQPVSQD